MDKELLRQIGFGLEVALIERGFCPVCWNPIDKEHDFRDARSRKEYEISGLCQECQNKVFGT